MEFQPPPPAPEKIIRPKYSEIYAAPHLKSATIAVPHLPETYPTSAPAGYLTNILCRRIWLSHRKNDQIIQYLNQYLNQEMNSIRDTLTKLESTNQESKSLHNPEALKSNRRKINGEIVNVLKKVKTIKSRLEEMDGANAESRRLSGCKQGTPIDRTRTAVANGLRKKLKELMMDFQVLRQRMMTEYKETVGRRYFTVTGEEANEEVTTVDLMNYAYLGRTYKFMCRGYKH